MENFITVQKYAAMHRQSVHTVIKKTMSGELPSVEKEENGKKVIYVRYDENTPVSKDEPVQIDESEIDYKKAYEELNKQYLILKTRYQQLLDSMNP